MDRKRFTEEEMTILRENAYTYKVTPGQLHFTAEFKERFWQEYRSGKNPREILRSCGYDPVVLGDSRINGIQLHIREAARKGEGFHSGRHPAHEKAAEEGSAERITAEEELKQLKAEVKYLRKEVDFLKKISSIRRTSGKSVIS